VQFLGEFSYSIPGHKPLVNTDPILKDITEFVFLGPLKNFGAVNFGDGNLVLFSYDVTNKIFTNLHFKQVTGLHNLRVVPKGKVGLDSMIYMSDEGSIN